MTKLQSEGDKQRAAAEIAAREQTIADIKTMMDASPISMNMYDENMYMIDCNETTATMAKIAPRHVGATCGRPRANAVRPYECNPFFRFIRVRAVCFPLQLFGRVEA